MLTLRLALFIALPFVMKAQLGSKPEEPATIEGSVANQLTGEPVKKVRISLQSLDHPKQAPLSVASLADGTFAFSSVSAGRYLLSAKLVGYDPQTYQSTKHGSTVTVQPGQTLRDFVLKLTPLAVINGLVTDDDGDPLLGVQVEVLRSVFLGGRRQLLPIGQARTNDLGEYRIAEIAPALYYLRAKQEHASANTGDWSGIVYYPNADRITSAMPLAIAAGAKLQSLNLRLRQLPSVSISGRVRAGNQAASGGTVMLMMKDPEVWGLDGVQRPIKEGGSFVLEGVLPGSYTLSVEQFAEAGAPRLHARMSLDVGRHNIDGLELSLAPSAEVFGRIVFEGADEHVTNAEFSNQIKVMLEPRTPVATLGVTGGRLDQTGKFKLVGVGPEIYDVDVTGLPPNAYIKTVRFGSADVTASGLDLRPGGAALAELSLTVSRAGGQIEGTIETPELPAPAGVVVVAVPEGARRAQARFFKQSFTESNGHFIMKGLAPGEYLLFAFVQIEQGAYRDEAFLRPLEDKGFRVSIVENSKNTVALKVIAVASGFAAK